MIYFHKTIQIPTPNFLGSGKEHIRCFFPDLIEFSSIGNIMCKDNKQKKTMNVQFNEADVKIIQHILTYPGLLQMNGGIHKFVNYNGEKRELYKGKRGGTYMVINNFKRYIKTFN